jgi:splicing factor 45
MVGPGEVDADLEAETIEECSKYGRVLSCKIIDGSRAVRIFLQFANTLSAKKGASLLISGRFIDSFNSPARDELNGRFFGGRTVTARYYSERLFTRGYFHD